MARTFRIGATAALTAAMLVTSLPAEARPGWYGGGGYGRGYRHRGHDVSFGDILLGAVIAGGVLVGADAIAKKNNRELDGVEPGAGARVSGDDGYDGGRAGNGRRIADRGEDAAVDACADAVERQLSASDGEARVDGIDYARRDGQGYRVEGSIAGRHFVCGARDGRADFVQFGEPAAERTAYRR